MRGYITSAAAAALVTMVASAATSLEWPVADPWLELSFGERWGETISRGVRLRSPLATVSAVSDGEAIFVRSGAGASLPASLGGLVVVAHAGGLLSVYAPLAPSFDPVVDGPAVEMGDQLGEVIAMTDEPLLHFSLHDAPRRAAVNPATLLPSLGSHPRPAIADVRVVRATTPSSAGAYHVEVVVGERAGGPPPYRAELLVDGRAERVITFDDKGNQQNKDTVLVNRLLVEEALPGQITDFWKASLEEAAKKEEQVAQVPADSGEIKES